MASNGDELPDKPRAGRYPTHMAFLTFTTPTHEDHLWHVLRHLDALTAALRATQQDPVAAPLAPEAVADLIYITDALRTAFDSDITARAFLFGQASDCHAPPGVSPQPPSTL